MLEPVIFTQIIAQIENFYKTDIFDAQTTLYWIVTWIIFICIAIVIQYIYRYFCVYKNNMKNYVETSKEFNQKIISMNYGEYLSGKQ